MKLLAATNRYYLLLSAGLFVLGSGVLYVGIERAVRDEMSEQLHNNQLELEERVAAGRPLPEPVYRQQYSVSGQPRPLGFSDTLLLDPTEGSMVPHRQLTFRALGPGQPPVWVTLRKSMVETDELLAATVGSMLVVLALLLAGIVGLHRYLSGRLWAPFQHTLATLRGYDLQQHQPLALPGSKIEEFAELNQALTQFSRRLVADYESLREFTANAAHETQTPLAIMQAQLEQLLQLPALATDAAAAPLLADLYGATRRLSRLHQALGLLSRIENGQFHAAVPLDLAALVREKAAQLAPLLDARDLTPHLHLAAAPPRQLHPGLADSLLHNLLHNAIRHNVPGGDVTVHLTAHALEVSNPGPVVSGDPARFFERFRKHNAASESPGLGLSIVQQICAYYGFGLSYTFAPAGARHTLRVAFGPGPGGAAVGRA
ncbi:histidine kinase dimerization/phospho-acceptor domain-containing protein [Hymenobacter sp. H14-R3]|uniref:sensor histidine kinase n=1 Tax=Hymenobacter sp. H14-R3 TaxID=3046308 RepID=UPI0024BBB6A4|nr:ATP-binding protein [Hymenobacter sp. H14-R3]MDJ0364227.1 histidine kinase dimerization/phospho-acceptor domain-containing protein [Hymenobacter sp. H14-R3]